MPNFEIEFEYSIREFGNVALLANNTVDAEAATLEYIKDVFPDVSDVKITEVREIV